MGEGGHQHGRKAFPGRYTTVHRVRTRAGLLGPQLWPGVCPAKALTLWLSRSSLVLWVLISLRMVYPEFKPPPVG